MGDASEMLHALHIMATEGGRAAECVSFLPTCRASWGDELLIRAAGRATALLRSGCRTTGFSVTRLHDLVSCGADLGPTRDSTLLLLACEARNEATACELLRVKSQEARIEALILAASLGLSEVVQFASCKLGRDSISVNSTYADPEIPAGPRYALHSAVLGGQPDMVRQLLVLGANPVVGQKGYVEETTDKSAALYLSSGVDVHTGTALAVACAPESPLSPTPHSTPSAGLIDAVLVLAPVVPRADALSALFWLVRYVDCPQPLSLLLAVVPFRLQELWAAAMHAASADVLAVLLDACHDLVGVAGLELATFAPALPQTSVPASSGWRTLTKMCGTLLDRALDRGPRARGVVEALLAAGAVPTRDSLLRAVVYGDVAALVAMLGCCDAPHANGTVESLSGSFTLLDCVCRLRGAGNSLLQQWAGAVTRTPLQRALVLETPEGPALQAFPAPALRLRQAAMASDDDSYAAAVLALLARGAEPTAFALQGACESRLPAKAVAALLAAFASPAVAAAAVTEGATRCLDLALFENVPGVPDLIMGVAPPAPQNLERAFAKAPLDLVLHIVRRHVTAVRSHASALVLSLARRLSRMHPGRAERPVWEVLRAVLAACPGSDVVPPAAVLAACCFVGPGAALSYGKQWPRGAHRLRIVRALIERCGAAAFDERGGPDIGASASCCRHEPRDKALSALEAAACSGAPELVTTLLNAGARPTPRVLLCAAAQAGDSECAVGRWARVVPALLSAPGVFGEAALTVALRELLRRFKLIPHPGPVLAAGLDELAAAIITAGARVTGSLLVQLAPCRSSPILSRLLDAWGGNGRQLDDVVDWDGDPLLAVAASQENVEYCTELLERGAAVGAAGRAGWTPLHFAAQDHATDVALLLLRHGADPHQPNADGDVPDLAWLEAVPDAHSG